MVPLRADCYQDRPLPDGPTLVLSGLGGVGKTQLAAALAERAWADGKIDLLVWVTASSRHAILAGYAQVAAEVLGVDGTDQDQAASQLLAWLAATHRRWLVVLDNLADPADLHQLWPPLTDNGRTVVTTWCRDDGLAGAGRTLVDVGLFTPAQSVAYLTQRLTARPDLADDPAALADALGHLPLALAQAAAYLLDQEVSCTAYRALLADRELRLDDLRPGALPDDHDRALAATWSLSVELADRAPHPGLAEPLLRLASVLDSNGIPEAVLYNPEVTGWLTAKRMANNGFRGGVEHMRRHLSFHSRAGNATTLGRLALRVGRRLTERWIRKFGPPVTVAAVRGTMRRLHLLSLAAHDPADHAGTFRVHALVQRATREGVSPQELAQVVRVAADALTEAWESAPQVPEVAQAFYASTRALTETAPEVLWKGPKGPHVVLVAAAQVLLDVGQERAAAEYLTWLVAEARRRLGPDSVHILSLRQWLSAALGRAGDQAAAVAEIEAVYADALRMVGCGWHDRLRIRHNLATAWYKAGRLTEAAAELADLVADCVAAFGRYDEFTLYNWHQLAHVRGDLGETADAVAVYEQLLVDARRLPTRRAEQLKLRVRVQLAHWRGKDGDAAAAVAELETLIAEQTPLLGPHHRRVLAMRQSLAHWRGEAGDPAGAVAAFEELLADWLLVQAPDNPDAMTTRQLLAQWRGAAGDPNGAVKELEGLLADRLRVLSVDHPDTLATRADLARWRATLP
ncbi:NB-ARC domain-containing protein [Micromonospora sp. H33]|uniref:NB-ARC domain-containing protein n=1 Tax=Micromonospora sp. H33 TaxID=3452215 RepID=UPI003F89732B